MTDPSPPDTSSFQELYTPIRPELRRYIHRLIGHPTDAEDLLQQVALKALERRHQLKKTPAFRPWIYRIATTTCLDFLRTRKRWEPQAQFDVQQECAENPELRQGVIETTQEAEFAFDVYEHLSFCFTCVGRSLPPDEQAALVLRELMGFSNQEAADALELSESQLRHRLSAGRRSMEGTFDGLCSLVNKAGICRQCAGFRQATAASQRGPSLPVLANSTTPWETRLAAVRRQDFQDGKSSKLHDLLFQRIQTIEARRASKQ